MNLSNYDYVIRIIFLAEAGILLFVVNVRLPSVFNQTPIQSVRFPVF
jgi:hypothetical protein